MCGGHTTPHVVDTPQKPRWVRAASACERWVRAAAQALHRRLTAAHNAAPTQEHTMTIIKNNAVVNRTVPTKPTSTDPLAAEIQRLRAENEALKAAKTTEAGKATLKVAEKGGVSAYGMGRFPVTAYAFTKASIVAGTPVFEGSGWHKLLALCNGPGADYTKSPVYLFIMANKAAIVAKQKASLAQGAAAGSDDSAL